MAEAEPLPDFVSAACSDLMDLDVAVVDAETTEVVAVFLDADDGGACHRVFTRGSPRRRLYK